MKHGSVHLPHFARRDTDISEWCVLITVAVLSDFDIFCIGKTSSITVDVRHEQEPVSEV